MQNRQLRGNFSNGLGLGRTGPEKSAYADLVCSLYTRFISDAYDLKFLKEAIQIFFSCSWKVEYFRTLRSDFLHSRWLCHLKITNLEASWIRASDELHKTKWLRFWNKTDVKHSITGLCIFRISQQIINVI